MPRGPASGSVFAYTTSTPASGPFVIQNLEPVRTQPSPSRFATVRIDTTSEPAPVSLIASAPTVSPDSSPGRKRPRWSSSPFLAIWLTHRFEWAP